MNSKDISYFFERQMASWPLLSENTKALKKVKTRRLRGVPSLTIQHNPARIASTSAKVDSEALSRRPCFLCDTARPPEQEGLPWRDYKILANPYPIFPGHLTVVASTHTPQLIADRITDMLALAAELENYAVFYNGPCCGASAPDHMHFQAVPEECLPILTEAPIADNGDISTFCCLGGVRGFSLSYGSIDEGADLFSRVVGALSVNDGEAEPRINVICASGRLLVIPRRAHRPACYGTGENQLLISPGAVDLGGVLIAPRESDFKSLNTESVRRIIDEVCLPEVIIDNIYANLQNRVNVGILTNDEIDMVLHGHYFCDGDVVEGRVSLTSRHCTCQMTFVPLAPDAYAEVSDVTIGVNFHWQRKLTQRFQGVMRVIPDDGQLLLINSVDIEDYLTSVISSEMNATSSEALLKAHAVISRSWLMAQIKARQQCKAAAFVDDVSVFPPRRVIWYGHDNHTMFDVCADDHCQRYQGIAQASAPAVRKAIDETRGMVLTCDGVLCDTRFSKCCGGVFEEFENCWEDVHKPYLRVARDSANRDDYPDLTREEVARRWILSTPPAYCNTRNFKALQQVLNGYDQETHDFYRWHVTLDAIELGRLIERKSGLNFGRIIDLIPLRRGTSGRICLLRIIGEKRSMDVGKELEIRRLLSKTHLYSSAFVVDYTPTGFVLHGAGWGHGVGLCQIGAAMMAEDGVDYQAILDHYYPGCTLQEMKL